MKIENGQYIKLLFRYGNLTIEGVVESWEKDNYIIRSLTDESLMIIQSPQEDIMVIKIMPVMEPAEDNPPVVDLAKDCGIKVILGALPKINDTGMKPEKVSQAIVRDALGAEEITELELRTKKLAELHLMKIKADREMVANRLKDHTISETRKVEYGLPGILKKPSTK